MGDLGICILVGRGDSRAVTELSFTHVTTKTWAYFGVFGFFITKFCKIMPPPTQATFWKYNGKSLLFFFLNNDRNAPKKIRTEIIYHFIRKLLSDLIPDLGKCSKQKNRKYVYLHISCVFCFGHFPRPGIKSESSVLIKCYIITVLNYFWAFWSVF